MLVVLLQRYVYGRPLELKRQPAIRNAVLSILDTLVEAGSAAAFRMRDDFVTGAHTRRDRAGVRRDSRADQADRSDGIAAVARAGAGAHVAGAADCAVITGFNREQNARVGTLPIWPSGFCPRQTSLAECGTERWRLQTWLGIPADTQSESPRADFRDHRNHQPDADRLWRLFSLVLPGRAGIQQEFERIDGLLRSGELKPFLIDRGIGLRNPAHLRRSGQRRFLRRAEQG